MRKIALVVLCSASALACQEKAAPVIDAAPPVSSVVASASASATPPPPIDGRELTATSTFADLVAVANKLGDKGASTQGCNLRRLGDGSYRFESSIAPGPISPALDDLDDIVVKGGAGVLIASPFGMIGSGDGITLQTLTPLPKSANGSLVPALFVTDKGVYMRVAMQAGMRFGKGDTTPMPESDIQRIKTELAPRAQATVVVPEAGVKLDRVREVLSWLTDAKGPVVLAVPLSKDVKPPKKVSETKTPLGADGCPGGADLMDIPKGSTAGAFGTNQMSKATDAYSKDAMQCSAKLPATSSGGRVKIDMRIEPDGKVSKACFMKDEIGDAALRTCILDHTKAHVFPAPETAGIVNYGTELIFTSPTFANRALCTN